MQHNKQLTEKIYQELHKRIASGKELNQIPLSSLFKIASNLNYENRLDDGEATSKVEHKSALDYLIARYQDAGSLEYQPKLRLVEPPVIIEEPKEKAK